MAAARPGTAARVAVDTGRDGGVRSQPGGLQWSEAFLVGAVLSPTDPVFAAAIVGRKEIPYRLRNLLNVESGLNDGLACRLWSCSWPLSARSLSTQ